MSNPEKTEQIPGKKTAFFRRLLAAITHNWGWKLGCLVAAIFLWGGLIMQDSSLMRMKVFNDVTISVMNEDALMRDGYIVVSGLDTEALSGLRMRVDVPQRIYGTVQASSFNARVDLSQIHGTGKQTLKVLTTSSTTYGTVTDLSVDTIEVEVEEYATRSRIPVRVATTGKLRDGIYAAAATADPVYVAVAGPKSQVDNIARCVVSYDLSELAYSVGTERTALPFRLEDRQENEIPTDLITVTPLNTGVRIDTITVEQTFYELVSLPVEISTLLTGNPAEGYEVISIDVDPSQVRVAFGEQTDASAIESVHASAPADISGLTSSRSFSVPLLRPTDAKYIGMTAVTVTVEIRPIVSSPTASPAAEEQLPESGSGKPETESAEPADTEGGA